MKTDICLAKTFNPRMENTTNTSAYCTEYGDACFSIDALAPRQGSLDKSMLINQRKQTSGYSNNIQTRPWHKSLRHAGIEGNRNNNTPRHLPWPRATRE